METNAYASVAIVEKEEGKRLIPCWQEQCFWGDTKCKKLGGSDYSHPSVTMEFFNHMFSQCGSKTVFKNSIL